MASSDQKTQMAELPPEVAARVGGGQPAPPAAPLPGAGASAVAQLPQDARTMLATPLPPASAAPAADPNRTILAGPGAPVGPAAVPPVGPAAVPQVGAQARTMMAEAPQLPPTAVPGAAYGAPPPAAASVQAVAPGGFAQGLPPPAAPGAPGVPGVPGVPAVPARPTAQPAFGQATVLMDPGQRAPRPVPQSPAVLRPASEVFAAVAGPETAGPPAYLRWIVGPLLMVAVALTTTFVTNHIWPPAINSGPGGLLVPKGLVRITTTPPGATVLLNGVEQPQKTPTEVRGKVGDKGQVKIVLAGYEPRDLTVVFASEERTPVNVKLTRPGEAKGKDFDKTLFDDKPGTKTKIEPEPDDEKPEAKDDKVADKAPDKTPDNDKVAVKDDKPEAKPQAKDDAKDDAEEEGGRRRGKGRRSRPGGEGRDSKEPRETKEVAERPASGAKATITVLVRPWAVVYIDGKQIKQTPLRDYVISAGKHTVMLVNESKGKRETISVNATAGNNTAINRTWE